MADLPDSLDLRGDGAHPGTRGARREMAHLNMLSLVAECFDDLLIELTQSRLTDRMNQILNRWIELVELHITIDDYSMIDEVFLNLGRNEAMTVMRIPSGEFMATSR